MRFSWWALLACVIAALLVCAFSGCSGRGAPAEPREFTALRTASTDHVTSLLMIKRWFSIMYTRTLFDPPDRQPVDPLPGDPDDFERYRIILPNGTTIDVLERPNGSTHRVWHYPDGREKTQELGPTRQDGAWRKIDLQEELWDGARLDYVFGWLSGPLDLDNEQGWEGTATLADGRDMAFTLQRNDDWDHLELRPDDGSRLEVEVPLRPKRGWTLWWPIFQRGADGSYQDAAGNTQDFNLRGPRDTRWQEWSFSAEDGTVVGAFTIEEDFAGAGELTMNGEVLGWLGWQSDGDGKLYPAGAGLLQAVPSAAARDFQIDQWIRNIAAMGPDPAY